MASDCKFGFEMRQQPQGPRAKLGKASCPHCQSFLGKAVAAWDAHRLYLLYGIDWLSPQIGSVHLLA